MLSQKEEIILSSYFLDIKDLLMHPKVVEMESYVHHGSSSCLKHSLYVSYVSYKISLKFKLPSTEIARGALLHDLFLYDWHTKGIRKLHGLHHPKIALVNATTYFYLTKREQEIILKHMWPLTPIPPRHLSTYLVTFVDKFCSVMDTLGLNKKFDNIYKTITTKEKLNANSV